MDGQPVRCGEFWLYPLALRSPSGTKCQAVVIVTRFDGDEDAVTAKSRAFPGTPFLFYDAEEAKAYALRYGRMLVTGKYHDLP